MPTPPVPPEEIAQLMQFIAEKAKNVKSPMNITELCRQFKEETGSLVSDPGLKQRIEKHRHRIHKMNEFDMETKVKMIFALSAPVDAAFLFEMKKVADVEVDDQQRIMTYKQKDGKLELNAKHLRISIKQAEQRDKSIIQFLAKKSETVGSPISDQPFLREFKETSGCPDTMASLTQRYSLLKKTIFKSPGFDKNTKIKMMFLSNAVLSDGVLEELRQDADVEVDERGKLTKYKAKDRCLELNGSHGVSNTEFHDGRWQRLCEKVNEDEKVDSRTEKPYEQQYIDLVKFLIETTKNATSPLNLERIANDFKTEFKSSVPKNKLTSRLQNDAIVELDGNQRIKKYKANDGSIELEGDHSGWMKRRSGKTKNTKTSVVNDPSESEEDEEDDEENSSESDNKEEEEVSTSSARKSDRLQKSKISSQNKNKKRQLPEQDSDSVQTPNSSATSARRKKARISYSSSEEEPSEEGGDEESGKSEDETAMESEHNNVENGDDDYDYDPPSYHQYNERSFEDEMESVPAEKKPENLLENTQEIQQEVLSEELSTSVRDLLVLLRGAVISVESPTLNPLLKKIELNIEQMGNGNQQIPLENIGILLKLCLVILTDLAPPECPPEEESTSLRDFLIALKVATCHINHQSIDSFHRELKKIIEELAVQDKRIQVEIVQRAMEVAINIISQ